jgi:5-methylcytosine-specific restriction endonuclease McrA
MDACPECGNPSHARIACHQCRRRRNAARACEVCGGAIARKAKRFCSPECFGRADSARRRALRPVATAKSRRVERDAATVGLSTKARLRLLHTWRSQGRACAYCQGPAETVDHVIPLVRGGTNHEGNLVPACRSCNSRKQDRLVIEFRLGRRASLTYTPFRERPKVERVVKAKPSHTCMVCHTTFTSGRARRKTCGDEHCSREWTGRCARDAYRRSVGLPVDPSRPTAYWLARLDAA